MPKLRKNRRIESMWGVKYYTAVKNAVFIQTQPYVPIVPPPSLKEQVPEHETLYMCPQCKDCFYFRSSLDDHIARKSWILGYWCQHCFVTTCKHKSTEDILCSTCAQVDHEKRLYLRSRGLRNNKKLGAIRIFYNQCQFFSHLKAHNVNLVNMGDLMLMPLPTNIIDWSPEIDVICEALMEHTFIIKIHIMDWLKDKAISNNWWQLTKDIKDNNPVTLILKGYKGRLHFKQLEIPIDEEISILNRAHPMSNNDKTYSDTVIFDSVENVDKKASSSSTDIISISDESVIENEESPCTVNDITFVDCGLSKSFEPEFLLNNKERKGDSTKSEQDVSTTQEHSNVINKSKRNKIRHLNSVSPNMIMSYGNTVITPKHDIKNSSKHSTNKRLWKSLLHKSNNNVSNKTVTESNKQEFDKKENKTLFNNLIKAESVSKVQSCVTKIDACKNKLDKFKQNIHTLTVNSGQKVVTFQSTKHIDINAIINQLPSHMINNKKIVFVEQNDDTSAHKNRESSSEGVIHLVPVDNAKLSGTKINEESVELSQIDKECDGNISKNQTEPKTFSNKVIYQNGQKYIIKQSSGFTKNLKNTANAVVPVKDVQESNSTNVPSLFYNIPPLIPLDSTEIENASNQERTNSFHNDVSPLTPSPSPSELSNSSSCDIQSKQPLLVKSSQKVDVSHIEHKDIGVQNTKKTFESLSFHKGEDQNLYLDVKFLNQKPIYTIVDTSTMITKCKEEMLNEFFHFPYSELKKRHDHLQEIAEEISRVMSFVTDNVIKENLKAVHILQTVLKHCIDKCIEKSDDIEEKDASLNEWEVEYQQVDKKPICKACNKIMKPKHYIPGFSKLARNDVYCSCYRHVCHKCNTYQGNSTRFVAHQTFHDKKKPYLCPDCYRKFSTYKSLEVHTWTACFHTLKRRVLGCKICEIDGFQDMESIARHFAIMHSHNKIVCDKCYLLLPSYSEYRKHHKNKHSDANNHHPIRLVLCKLGRCIVRYEDYMLHMEKHIVVQRLIWFKCPFCTFIHVEAKRIMSHLQSGHESRLKELISSEALWNVFQVETAASLLKNNLQQNKFTNAHDGSCKDGTVMPKIINARTITSEIFERGTQGTDDHLINYDTPHCSKIVNPNSELSVPKILDVRSIAECEKTETTSKFVSRRTSEEIKGDKTRNDQEIKTELEDVINYTWATEAIKPISDPLNIELLQQDHFLRTKNGQDVGDTLQNEICEKKEVQLVEQTNQANTREQLEDIKHESISKPPPLARIPQHVLETSRPKKVGQTTKKKKTSIFSHDQNINRDLFQRVALISSANSNEILNFTCPLCRELINTSKSVTNSHFQSKHSQDCKLSTITVSLLRISSEFINGGYKELLDKKKRKSESTMSSSKKRRRWNPKKYNNDGKNGNFTGVGLCVTQETAEDSEGNFRCKKCDQRCSNMSTLRDHIASNHRIKGRYLVCLECGDNFVVAPSLQMHLKAFHGIEDPITYMMQNTSYAPDNVDNLEVEGKSIEANQCHVCMAVFEDKAAVDKHLRVHGMAFLNRKRIEAQNALKSPEKKSEMEEEKSISVKASPKENIRKDKPAETILEKISATICS
ncbi:uncharacterized protein LOC122538411 [Frieseomelitta varia]|uniref:uncharacterized protein LOC122538411 n=1 Tax=Frieseomelitta varia TaxID=561572 RepID=UPI001CB68F9C|nr:uncharacterized protein LOC122538411 [Frieseomelitta varia]XP_043528389.1 uncharacterized protein LOC122538411 [Frieseomelitta varia]